MKKTSTDLGLLIMRLGFSAGMLTHGYGKLLRVIEGNFQFKNPLELALNSLDISNF
jgi:putative oxidoreductase